MTVEALAGFDLTRKEKERAKNMFALGLLSWMYSRPTDATENFLAKKFAQEAGDPRRQPGALRAGFNYGETTEEFVSRPTRWPGSDAAGHLPQHHRQCRAGLRAGRRRSPVRPAAGARVLPDHPGLRHPAHALGLKRFGVTTMQAEDEIAGIGMAHRRVLRWGAWA
jgi:2-oxoglutarate ferredoxin oxidoreductase subunit alpha